MFGIPAREGRFRSLLGTCSSGARPVRTPVQIKLSSFPSLAAYNRRTHYHSQEMESRVSL